MFLKLFIIFLFHFQCYFCFPWIDPIFENINLSGMVTIFTQCSENSCSNHKINKYQCQGFLIHPSIVLTIADCVPEEIYKQFVKIHVYDWKKYPDVTNKTPFSERNLAQIIHHPFYNNSAEKTNSYNLVVLILEKPIHLPSVMKLPEFGRNYSNDCTLINLKGDMTKGALIEQRYFTGILNKSNCFDLVNTVEPKNRQTIHKNVLCAASEILFPCGGSLGNPLMCPYLNDDTLHVLKGILINRSECISEYIDIQHSVDWIDVIKNHFNLMK